MAQTIQLYRSTTTPQPPTLLPGALSVLLEPVGFTKLWIGSAQGNRLLLSNDPADSSVGTGAYLPLTGGTLTGSLTLPGNAADVLQAVPLQQLTATVAAAPFLPIGGGTLTGPLTLPGNTAVALQAVPLQQVNTIVGAYLPLAGGIVTGNLTVTAPTQVTNLLVGAGTAEWTFGIDNLADGSKRQTYRANIFDRWDGTSGTRFWFGTAGELMTLTAGGDLGTTGTISTLAGVYAGFVQSSGDVRTESGNFLAGVGANTSLSLNLGTGNWTLFTNGQNLMTVTGAAGNASFLGSVTAQSSVIAFATAFTNGFGLLQSGGSPRLSFGPTVWLEETPANGTIYYWINGAIVWGYGNTTQAEFQFINNVGAFAGRGAYVNVPPPLGAELHAAPIGYGLDAVLRLRPVTFQRSERAEIGFLAEDVQPVVPEAVVEAGLNGETVLGLRESSLLAVTVNAIKELDERLRKLENEGPTTHGPGPEPAGTSEPEPRPVEPDTKRASRTAIAANGRHTLAARPGDPAAAGAGHGQPAPKPRGR